MHFSISTIAVAALSLLPGAALANFDIYRVKRTVPYAQGGVDVIWQIFSTPPSCDQALNSGYFEDKRDVSGNKIGVRCEGSGCSQTKPPGDISILEMHFSNSPLHHWTIYKDRGYSMVGLDGKTYGNCIVFPNADYDCDFTESTGKLEGRRKFRCLTALVGPQ
ncbi:hypothetical protein V8F20_010807 [Naviculisporaceae sp. PSN 640]